jgi:RNA recognition motif-containing protein
MDGGGGGGRIGGGKKMEPQKTKKIFVGGLNPTTDKAKLREFFST